MSGIPDPIGQGYRKGRKPGIAGSGAILVVLATVFLMGSCGARKVEPAIFQDLINSEKVEYGLTISHKADELYFTRASGRWGKDPLVSSIYQSRRINGKWSIPVKATFHPGRNTSDPHLSHGDNRIYFISDMPVANDSSPGIWYAERRSSKDPWKEPRRLDYPVNSEFTEYSPVTTRNGDLYFASDRPGGMGQGDLYVAKRTGNTLAPPVSLGNVLNSKTGEWNLDLNDNGDVLLFEASQRSENVSSYGDLYISFKKDGAWSHPQNVRAFNTSGSDLYPVLLNNKQVGYSTSETIDGLQTDIYIRDLKPLLHIHRRAAKWPATYPLVVNRSAHTDSL